MKFIYLSKIDSTNNYASKLSLDSLDNKHTIVCTSSQTKGKGLGLNTWFSENNKNLIFSLIYFPNIYVSSYFEIIIRSSLGIIDYLDSKGVNCEIKWPNDIFHQNKKLCGILIQNDFKNHLIEKSIIGVGLNLNTNKFPDNLPNPISLSDITNEVYNVENEIINISNCIINSLEIDISFDELKVKYLNKLYRFNKFFRYFADNKYIIAKIIDIQDDGFLVLEDDNNNILRYNFKQIKYII